MIIMALDHVRFYFHISAFTANPLDIENLSIPLYLTRWITHFCAPIFVFLSGTSIYLQSFRKTKKALGIFVIKRGLWLIFAEWTIVAFAWTFNPYFPSFQFTVIWAIGISMVLLGLLLLVNTSYKALLTIGLSIVIGHNALDFIEADPTFKANFWWDLLHSGYIQNYAITEHHAALLVYPFLPWTGLMLLGFCFGKLFENNVTSEIRVKKLRVLGIILLTFFVIVRWINGYGDPIKWEEQSTITQTFFSFINVHKYPPSLLFMSITIGVGVMSLSYLEKLKNTFTDILKTYGRTAFYYYIIHIYFIHLIVMILYFVNGHTMSEIWNYEKNVPFLFVIPEEGKNVLTVYIIWICVVIALYPLCKWYDNYKIRHKGKWWLSYL
jgi:uncharacterized membrane protein